MKPSQTHHQLLESGTLQADASQAAAVQMLDQLYERLDTAAASGWRRWFGLGSAQPVPSGLYFWGGVGRGKTLLMDLFHQSLADSVSSRRVHFHQFMNEVHAALGEHRNRQQPLEIVARDIASRYRVLCLDEFVIIDIGDAMIMAGLLQTLFAEGVVLVTTSNARPDELYRDGLQRARFVPAIRLLEQHCEVFNLDGGEDYRLLFLRQTDLYSVPHDAEVEARLRQHLEQHASGSPISDDGLVLNGRRLATRFCAGDTVWFDFKALCDGPRSQNDYLELARLFNTLIVTDICQMHTADDDIARRFVLLIDVLYDHGVKLICSAEVPPDQLYTGKRLAFEFERTLSRLLEMQSADYLAQAHSQQ